MGIEKLKQEIDSIEEMLLQQPRNIELLLKHAQLLRQLGFQLGNREFANQALKDNNSVIDLDPGSSLSWLERGMTYYTLDKQDLAIQDFSASIKIQPSDRAYYNRGVSLWRKLELQGRANWGSVSKKDVERIFDDYQEVININPEHENAYYNRGVLYMRMGKFKPAVKDFTKAIELRPDNPVTFFNRGTCYENLSAPRYSNLDDLLKAIDDYSTALKLKPDYIQALYNRAICFEFLGSKGRYGERENVILAINDYNQILEIDPRNTTVLFNRGWALEAVGQINNALRDYERFIEISGDKVTVKQIRAHVQEIKSKKS